MSKSPKESYAVPEWMRQFLPLFQNTGGNDVEELLHDEDTNMFANSVRYMFIVSARSQFALLMDMYSKGIITGRTGEDESSDALTDGQLLFRLQDFYGAGQDAIEINDHEYAHECTDVVSIIREVIESRKKLKAAEKQIAELERDETQLSVPDDVMAAIQKVARIRLDLNDFDGDKRGIAESLGEAEEALIEVVNRRAAMLQRGKS
ncbi:TPA: hypothetical protein OTP91_003791 [Enterobacter hormaechei]|uniref:Uncharacterized protein n=1 Tax=Enterobacter hormaechei subsp. hoffmannii TaxID=1812934 RepID=A0AAI9D7A5_9ENTR|nr:hypothetical protein [Enterobacter hormaechei]EMB2809574.1 hypothetical protein [Enterobacter hormaechei subsp. hoffmannii]MBJ6491426.1 hypothetical protein [Enterobacter hormaechei]MBK4266458.1 hypothetical protein [Enterobacter hormaechei]HCT1844423.1 hypothetical protein [Enterobacter hormaechei]